MSKMFAYDDINDDNNNGYDKDATFNNYKNYATYNNDYNNNATDNIALLNIGIDIRAL